MCTGRVDPPMIADAFLKGADGVMVVGCHFGDCHYITGNYQGKIKVQLASRTLEYVGLNPLRVSFNQCSSAEGERFVNMVTAFDKQIREIGPLGQAETLPLALLKEKLAIAQTILSREKLRWVVGKFTEFETKGNKYGERFTDHEMWRTLDTIIMDEVTTYEILAAIERGPLSVKELAAKLGQPAPHVLKYVLALQRRGFLGIAEIAGTSPRYRITDPMARQDAA